MEAKPTTAEQVTRAGIGSGEMVRLLCRKCGAETMTKREPYEPHTVATVTCICVECDNGGFDDLQYLDADGRDLGDIFKEPNDADRPREEQG